MSMYCKGEMEGCAEGEGSGLGKQDLERRVVGEHAAAVVAAERNDHRLVLGAELAVDVLREGLAPRQAARALRHCGAGRIEAAERQRIEAAEQVDDGPCGDLLLQLV